MFTGDLALQVQTDRNRKQSTRMKTLGKRYNITILLRNFPSVITCGMGFYGPLIVYQRKTSR